MFQTTNQKLIKQWNAVRCVTSWLWSPHQIIQSVWYEGEGPVPRLRLGSPSSLLRPGQKSGRKCIRKLGQAIMIIMISMANKISWFLWNDFVQRFGWDFAVCPSSGIPCNALQLSNRRLDDIWAIWAIDKRQTSPFLVVECSSLSRRRLADTFWSYEITSWSQTFLGGFRPFSALSLIWSALTKNRKPDCTWVYDIQWCHQWCYQQKEHPPGRPNNGPTSSCLFRRRPIGFSWASSVTLPNARNRPRFPIFRDRNSMKHMKYIWNLLRFWAPSRISRKM